MKKIITAINNPELNNKLKKLDNFKIIGKDMQYREAILEFLEENKNIDLIIINENILGEITFKNLIENIKFINEKIEIIFILNKENNILEKILKKNKIKIIYYEKNDNLFELIKNEINKTENNKLKKINNEKNNNYNNKKRFFKEKKKKNLKYNIKNICFDKIKNYRIGKLSCILRRKKPKKEKKKRYKNRKDNDIMLNKIITFSGNQKSGKTTLALVTSQYLSDMNYKVLLIDFDLKKKDLSFILRSNLKANVKNNELNFYKLKNKVNLNNKKTDKLKNDQIENYKIKKLNNNFYFLSNLNKILKKNDENKNRVLIKKIKNILITIREKFDYIVLDISSENYGCFNKEIIEISDKNFILMESNLLGIKELEDLLKLYLNAWNINKNSLHIVANKANMFSLNLTLIHKIFPIKNRIIKILENKKYTIFINNFFK